MYKIKIEIKFRAGHRLLPPYIGKCNNPHGEGYTAIFEFEQEMLNECDMIEDFGVVKRMIKEWIDLYLDHAYICNEKDEVGIYLKEKGFKVFKMKGNPTAENIANLIYTSIKPLFSNLKRVGIVESFEDSVAWYEDDK